MTDLIDPVQRQHAEWSGTFWRITADTRGSVLASWFDEARLAYFNASNLLAVRTVDHENLRSASPATVWLDILTPAYMELVQRVESDLYRGDQLSLFAADFETALARRWTFFACNLMREPDSSAKHRLILQATVGLEGGLDRPAAARSFADALADQPLPTNLWREPPWF